MRIEEIYHHHCCALRRLSSGKAYLWRLRITSYKCETLRRELILVQPLPNCYTIACLLCYFQFSRYRLQATARAASECGIISGTCPTYITTIRDKPMLGYP